MTAALDERAGRAPAAAGLEERIVAALEAVARELALIRARLEETEEKPAANADSGPWLRRQLGA